jgi:hypothetical protein
MVTLQKPNVLLRNQITWSLGCCGQPSLCDARRQRVSCAFELYTCVCAGIDQLSAWYGCHHVHWTRITSHVNHHPLLSLTACFTCSPPHVMIRSCAFYAILIRIARASLYSSLFHLYNIHTDNLLPGFSACDHDHSTRRQGDCVQRFLLSHSRQPGH